MFFRKSDIVIVMARNTKTFKRRVEDKTLKQDLHIQNTNQGNPSINVSFFYDTDGKPLYTREQLLDAVKKANQILDELKKEIKTNQKKKGTI